jgi:hypothetical protein
MTGQGSMNAENGTWLLIGPNGRNPFRLGLGRGYSGLGLRETWLIRAFQPQALAAGGWGHLVGDRMDEIVARVVNSMAASDRFRRDSSPSGESRHDAGWVTWVLCPGFPPLSTLDSRRDLTPEKRGRSSVVRLDACSAAETARFLSTEEASFRETTLSTIEDHCSGQACPCSKPSRSTLQRTPLTGPSNASLNREHL